MGNLSPMAGREGKRGRAGGGPLIHDKSLWDDIEASAEATPRKDQNKIIRQLALKTADQTR